MMLKQVAIIGSGLTGVKIAETLRRDGYDGRLWLIGEEAYLPYYRPPLSKEYLLEDDMSLDRISIHDDSYYLKHRIDLILGTRVDCIDPTQRTISFGSRRLTNIDATILCTGGAPRRLDCSGGDEGVLYLRNIGDAQEIATSLRPGEQVVVIGGGLIGCEVAAGARMRGASVTIIEAGPTIMWRTLGEAVATQMERLHRVRGIELKTKMSVSAHQRVGKRHILDMDDGSRLEADVVVAGLGLLPNVRLAQEAGICVSDGIVVDAALRTDAPHVLAAGDVASFPSTYLGGRVRLETIHNANDHGERVACTLLGRKQPVEDVPWGWSDQYNVNLHMAGDINPRITPVFRGKPDSDSFCALFQEEGVLRGAVGLNRPSEMAVFRRLIKQGNPISADNICDESMAVRTFLSPT